jgi:hypothetical protein
MCISVCVVLAVEGAHSTQDVDILLFGSQCSNFAQLPWFRAVGRLFPSELIENVFGSFDKSETRSLESMAAVLCLIPSEEPYFFQQNDHNCHDDAQLLKLLPMCCTHVKAKLMLMAHVRWQQARPDANARICSIYTSSVISTFTRTSLYS